MEDTSISMDAPPIFQIDAVVQHDAVSALGSEFRVGKVGGGVDMERGKVVHGMSIEQVTLSFCFVLRIYDFDLFAERLTYLLSSFIFYFILASSLTLSTTLARMFYLGARRY